MRFEPKTIDVESVAHTITLYDPCSLTDKLETDPFI